VRFVERFRCRVALLSIGGIDLSSGFMDFHPEEAEFSQAVIAQASRVIVAADHSKFGRQASVKVCDLSGVDALITDQAPPPSFAKRLADADVEIVSPAS
jgi:DeoR family glycerol-3-phosphate regulon repressor